jgi:hypothetical protein
MITSRQGIIAFMKILAPVLVFEFGLAMFLLTDPKRMLEGELFFNGMALTVAGAVWLIKNIMIK